VSAADLTQEVIAQVKLFTQLTGYPPRFLDGHQHAHIVPGVPQLLISAWPAASGHAPPPLVRAPIAPFTPFPPKAPISPLELSQAAAAIAAASASGTSSAGDTAGAVAEGREVAKRGATSSTRLPDALCSDLDRGSFYALVQGQAAESAALFVRAGWAVPCAFVGFGTMGRDCSIERIHAEVAAAKSAMLLQAHGSARGAAARDPSEAAADAGCAAAPQGAPSVASEETSSGFESQHKYIVEVMTHPGAPVSADEAHLWGCGTGADDFSQSLDRQFEADQLQSTPRPPWA